MRIFATLTLLLAACLTSASPSNDAAVVLEPADAAMQLPADLAGGPPDGGVMALEDLAKPPLDLVATDLTGLLNCYGLAVCDPTQAFCLKYHSGSEAAPGVLSGPACYEPSVACADNGQNMDCGCIQNDDGLGLACQGSCVDNGNGTFDCYAK